MNNVLMKFNILDARGLISYVMRGEIMKKIRAETKKCGEKFLGKVGIGIYAL